MRRIVAHLLVTNDYPPKIGGIQSYLYELWRRLPSERVTVLTRSHPDAAAFDAQAPHRIIRIDKKNLLPRRGLAATVRSLAAETGSSLVVLDPIFPLGAIGPALGIPYALVLHGAEVTVPGGLPTSRERLEKSLAGASLLIAAGNYPALEAQRLSTGPLAPTVIVPPGVDTTRFHPLSPNERSVVRRRLEVHEDAQLIVAVSRLVPRKGMDVLIEAAARLGATRPNLQVLISGAGREENRLRKAIAKLNAPVRLIGRTTEEELPDIYGAADVFAMFARNRWFGLEQEGFGIVYLEAAACGVPQVAGRSGGTTDAVEDGETGLIVDRPGDVVVATEALAQLLDDGELRQRLGHASRVRAERLFNYDLLAAALDTALIAAEEESLA